MAQSEPLPESSVSVEPKTGMIVYVKIHWRALIVTSAVIGATVLVFSVLPVVHINQLRLVNLGASVKLESGQIAKLKIANISVKIVHFTNQTCAQIGACFGADIKAVEYELNVNDTKYSTGSASRANMSSYQIITESSDYKTYSIVKIIKTN